MGLLPESGFGIFCFLLGFGKFLFSGGVLVIVPCRPGADHFRIDFQQILADHSHGSAVLIHINDFYCNILTQNKIPQKIPGLDAVFLQNFRSIDAEKTHPEFVAGRKDGEGVPVIHFQYTARDGHFGLGAGVGNVLPGEDRFDLFRQEFLVLQDLDKTLTDNDVERVMSKLLSTFQNEFGATLR